MKVLNVFLLVSLLSSLASAQQLPGVESYPVLQCPATNDSVKVFRKKLQDLKSAIKSDANCEPIKADIKHLGDLLTKDRPEFVDLIAKGQIQGLAEQEAGKVQNYVNDLTVTAYNLLAVVTGNDACFEEDKQGTSLQFLSSVIGEGAKLLAIAGGPELAPIISIAGEAITGFMGAMQTIADNAIGYDFSKNDQQIAYAESLCTLFDARRELNNIVSSAESVGRLTMLMDSLQKQVNTIIKKCPECAEIKSLVDAQVSAAGTTASIRSVDQVWSKEFNTTILAKAKDVDKLYTNPVGTNIYRDLRTLSWLPIRIEALRSNEFNTDIVLSSVIGEMDSVEEFMIKDQAPNYLDSLLRDAEETLWKLNDTVNNQVNFIARNGGEYINPLNGFTYLAGVYTSPEEFYTKLFPALENIRTTTQDDQVKESLKSFFQELDTKSRHIDIQLDVFDKYCSFFHQSLWGWDGAGLKNICNDPYVFQIKQQAFYLTNYRVMMEGEESSFDAAPVVVESAPSEEISTDWVDAMRQNVEEQASDVSYVERKL